MDYSDDPHAIRQIKFSISCEYEVKTSEIKIQDLNEDLSQILWYTFSHKWEKFQTWVLEHHIKLEIVQRLFSLTVSPNCPPRRCPPLWTRLRAGCY